MPHICDILPRILTCYSMSTYLRGTADDSEPQVLNIDILLRGQGQVEREKAYN